ncbi:tumor necrosis factor receptor superfamily member 1A [Embiotoca jacksoni]|uniref:tumor necrosis factor receptor superfamily member 1A n=1 Tax=Embiotoca jacksoni TaxID=100190 RepID=UPI003703C108
MEVAGHRRRWSKEAVVGTLLLLVCMFNAELLNDAGPRTCPNEDYLTEDGICCNKCHEGYKFVENCRGVGLRTNCTPCPDGQYTNQMNFSPNCRRCRRCKTSNHEVEESPCQKNQNTICRCEDGYYNFKIDSETFDCRKCTQCRPDEKEKQICTPEKNTRCECLENFYKVKNKCEPCRKCIAECKHFCASPTQKNDPDGRELINAIAGCVAGIAILFALGILITFKVTKTCTENHLNPSSEPSRVSPDSCEHVLICEELSENPSLKAVPQSPLREQEQPNLPDCVPLEINIPELIYTVLDLVHVQQVKQLVRSLGVKDIEIEQAELDHRLCREAHYQMLRVWAESGSHAGGGVRGGMLHRPLLQDLLDKLRDMHLGRAAEELETKYGIQ